MEALQTGIIIKTHGLKGELKLKSTTHFASKRYKKGNKVYLSKDGVNFEKFTVKSYRFYQGFDFVTFNELPDLTAAEKYLGFAAFIDKNTSKLEKGQYYFSDLLGCKVFNNDTKELLGEVIKIEEFPAQINLAVKSSKDEKTYFIPFIEVFIKSVDIETKEIYISVIEGLI